MNKVYPDAKSALEGILKDGMMIMSGGFGLCGIAETLSDAIRDSGVKNLKFDCVAPIAPETNVRKMKSYPHNSNAAKVFVIIGFNHEVCIRFLDKNLGRIN